MTYKKSTKRNLPFFWIKKHKYTLLDDIADFEIISEKELSTKDLDIIWEKALKFNSAVGELRTEKGVIYYNFNPKTWEEIKDEE